MTGDWRCSIADRDFKFAPVIGRVLSSQMDPQAASAKRFQKRLRALEGSCPAPSEPSQGHVARVQLQLRVPLDSSGCLSTAQCASGQLRVLRVQHKLRIASFRLPDCFLQAAAFRLLHWSVVHRMNSANYASVSKSRARQQKLGDTSSNASISKARRY